MLTGCGSAASTSTTQTVAPTVAPAGDATPSATASSAAAPQAATSVRGNLIKTVGQNSGETYDGASIAEFVVKSIEVDAKCTSKYAQPPKGHIVILNVDAQTTPDLAKTATKRWSLNMFGWKAIAENGTTVNGSVTSIGCLDNGEELPAMGPAEKATGKIAFDVPSATGILVYKAPGQSAGWEWSFPAK